MPTPVCYSLYFMCC